MDISSEEDIFVVLMIDAADFEMNDKADAAD